MKKSLLKITFMIASLTTAATSKSQTISAEFPFESKFIEINAYKMHYIESGSGDPILFLHGMPMSTYSWRNIIPHVSGSARCLAIDFMGFGKSEKTKKALNFDEHYDYLAEFIDRLDLKNITLVMTDIGGILGQKYARLHPQNIKGLVFMETPITDAETFHSYGGMMQRMLFWMAGKEKFGYRMFVQKNMFIKMMPKLIKRKLSKEEQIEYGVPFTEEASREALYILPNSFPKKGKNAQAGDMADYLNQNSNWLMTAIHPKLVLAAKPGMIMNKKTLAWIDLNLQDTNSLLVV